MAIEAGLTDADLAFRLRENQTRAAELTGELIRRGWNVTVYGNYARTPDDRHFHVYVGRNQTL